MDIINWITENIALATAGGGLPFPSEVHIPENSGDDEGILGLLGFGRPTPSPPEVLFAMALSFGLNLLIGTLYKRTYKGTRYSQDYVHTLVIIGTVTTILLLVVATHKNAAGIGLALLAATSSAEPAWDRILLVASPPQPI